MALFKIADTGANRLEEVGEIDTGKEKGIQKITEVNLQNILPGLDFVCSEFSVKGYRIDTLAYDKEMKSFVIIEYKVSKNYSVVDQGMNYLSLMLENKAEFVLKYNEEKKATMKKKQIDWSQSKVVFICHTFTPEQKGATNFRDFPVDLWEFKKYKGNLIDYRQVEKSATQASIKELSSKGKNIAIKKESVEKITREIEIYTEERHLKEGTDREDVVNLYYKFRSGILNLSDTIKIKVRGTYIGFDTDDNIVGIKIYSGQLAMWINMPMGTLDDPKDITKDVSERGHHGRGHYQININSDENLEYILSLVRQSLRYEGKRP